MYIPVLWCFRSWLHIENAPWSLHSAFECNSECPARQNYNNYNNDNNDNNDNIDNNYNNDNDDNNDINDNNGMEMKYKRYCVTINNKQSSNQKNENVCQHRYEISNIKGITRSSNIKRMSWSLKCFTLSSKLKLSSLSSFFPERKN